MNFLSGKFTLFRWRGFVNRGNDDLDTVRHEHVMQRSCTIFNENKKPYTMENLLSSGLKVIFFLILPVFLKNLLPLHFLFKGSIILNKIN
jgi:hypothetical protein